MATATTTSFSHDAHCPEISPTFCADPDVEIIAHEHHQGVTLTRTQASLSYGMGKGWQAMAQLPVDIKHLTIDYTTPDGQPYDPPYGNIHHRNETLVGLGDGQWKLQKYGHLGEGLTLGGGFGTTVPLGRTEEDPYELSANDKTHQHVQMGSGTIDPVGSVSMVWMSHQWGWMASAHGRMPLYDNSKGYRPSPTINFNFGPTYRISAKTMVMSSVGVRRDWQAKWGGEPDPLSGFTAIDGGAAVIYRFTPTTAVLGHGKTTLGQWSDEARIKQGFVGTVGVSITPSGKAP